MKTTNIIIKASRSLCGTGALALLLSASSAQAELIANGTFEAVSGGNGSNATSWIKDGSAYGVYNEAGRPGPYAGSWSYVPGNGTQNTGVYQDLAIPLESGKRYTLSWYQNPWSNNNGLDVIVGVYSGAGRRDLASSYTSVSLDVDVTDPTKDTWNLHTYTFTAVGNSTSVYFGTLIPAGSNNSADIDNVSLTEVPATAPQSSNDSRTIDEDTQVLLATDDFGTYSDPNSVPLAAVKISTLASAGSLEYDTTGAGAWAAVTVDQEIIAADITAGRLRFSPVAEGNGTPYATIGFRVGNGTLFSIHYTLTVNVTPVNDYPPACTNLRLGVAQGGSKTLVAENFSFADADGNDTLQKVKVTQLPTAGSLTLSSVAVTLNQEIAVADINGGNLRFTPEPTASGFAYATFGFKVSDGTFYSPTSATMTIDIVALSVVQSVSPIPFANSGTLVGAAVFGNAGTYDGIPFALWSPPFTSAVAFGSGVTAVANAPFSNIDPNLGGVAGGQYRTANYSSGSVPGRLTVSGLDSAQTYRFQIGFGDLRVGLFPYSVNASITLSNASAVTVPLATGAVTTADDYALLTVTVTGTTSIRLDLPTAANGVGPFIAGFSVHRLGTSTYDTWANGTFVPPLTAKLPGDNQDGDSLTNLQEYAFGTQPTGSTGEIVYSGGTLTTPGAPKLVAASGTYSMVFGRRADYVAAGLTYTVQFSADLITWVDNNDGTNPPVQVATDGTINVMSVPFVNSIDTPSGSPKPTFARVKVTMP